MNPQQIKKTDRGMAEIERKAAHVFRKSDTGVSRRCIDNSYGHAIIGKQEEVNTD